jgi:hypothetical protein
VELLTLVLTPIILAILSQAPFGQPLWLLVFPRPVPLGGTRHDNDRRGHLSEVPALPRLLQHSIRYSVDFSLVKD